MDSLQQIYLHVMNYVPEFLRPYAAIALALLLVYSVFQVLKRNFAYIIALIVLLPASVPILKSVFNTITTAVKYLLGMK